MRLNVFLAKIFVGIGIPIAIVFFAYGIELFLENNKLEYIEDIRPFWGFVAIALLTNVAYGIFKGTIELENTEYVAVRLTRLAVQAVIYVLMVIAFIVVPPYLKEGVSGSDPFWFFIAVGLFVGIIYIAYRADIVVREINNHE